MPGVRDDGGVDVPDTGGAEPVEVELGVDRVGVASDESTGVSTVAVSAALCSASSGSARYQSKPVVRASRLR